MADIHQYVGTDAAGSLLGTNHKGHGQGYSLGLGYQSSLAGAGFLLGGFLRYSRFKFENINNDSTELNGGPARTSGTFYKERTWRGRRLT